MNDRVSYNALAVHSSGGGVSNQALQAAAFAASQRKASISGSNTNGMNNRAIVAAAAAAFRYPLGLPMGTGGPGNPAGALGDLSDPQWNILSSLMSPHITGMNGGGVIPTSEGTGGEQFQLQEEPNDLQLQMHLAMQAQMNLHRQMLTRKVEVSQHLINNQHDGNNGANSNMFGQQWGNQAAQQQRHQQQQYFQQDQQQRAAAAARQALASSSHHPQMQMNLAASAMNQNPRPSLPPRNAASAALPSSSMGNTQMSVVSSTGQGSLKAPIPTAVGPPVDVSALLSENNGGPDATLGASLGFDKPTADEDSLDLYRWDRIDLNVELDDDDLFGFLKS